MSKSYRKDKSTIDYPGLRFTKKPLKAKRRRTHVDDETLVNLASLVPSRILAKL